MPRRPAPKAPKSASMQQCDCPICPIVEYGRNIKIGQVVIEVSEPDKNAKINCKVYLDKTIPNSLSNNFNKIMLFARNNEALSVGSALQIHVGNAAINVGRMEKNLYAIKVSIFPDREHHEAELQTYTISDSD